MEQHSSVPGKLLQYPSSRVRISDLIQYPPTACTWKSFVYKLVSLYETHLCIVSLQGEVVYSLSCGTKEEIVALFWDCMTEVRFYSFVEYIRKKMGQPFYLNSTHIEDIPLFDLLFNQYVIASKAQNADLINSRKFRINLVCGTDDVDCANNLEQSFVI